MENVYEKQFEDIITENVLELKANTSLQKKTSKYQQHGEKEVVRRPREKTLLTKE